MSTTSLALMLLRNRRSAGDWLAVAAFAASSWILLVVLGGVDAFYERMLAATAGAAFDPDDMTGFYVMLACIAAAMLLPAALTLGGAAARLSVARRSHDLAALRLVGATNTQVTRLTIIDSVVQSGLGFVGGVALYAASLPLVAQLRFQGGPFGLGELVLPWWAFPAALVLYLILAACSALISMQKVMVSPLGVAARQNGARVSAVRLVLWAVLAVAFMVVAKLQFQDLMVTMVVVAGGIAAVALAVNIIGPLLLWVLGRIVASIARGPAAMLAGFRLMDDPRSAWRGVSGVSFAMIVAGMTCMITLFSADASSDPAEAVLLTDLGTGGLLTLGIAALTGALSTGIGQAAKVVDSADAYRALHISGGTVRQLHRARWAETLLPLTVAIATGIVSALVLVLPLMGSSALDVKPLVGFIAAATGAIILILCSGIPADRVISRAAAVE